MHSALCIATDDLEAELGAHGGHHFVLVERILAKPELAH